ncbi:hypothetical protein J7W19_03530 [Streptomyces mobaraensis NBRC 13819 = DSM 40847]|uniref:hypothetical protein n=1 Tax=Streptomyces mobaraensis TaxID=35621 RepID=UPI00131A100F|nr:hypothetical protein [Streptomyces mobaraensis]QTT72637.1 hypothetical protein J7W19_03530 [Streptomyces mobaraensis NBRC 13819 = DSM 40847]
MTLSRFGPAMGGLLALHRRKRLAYPQGDLDGGERGPRADAQAGSGQYGGVRAVDGGDNGRGEADRASITLGGEPGKLTTRQQRPDQAGVSAATGRRQPPEPAKADHSLH